MIQASCESKKKKVTFFCHHIFCCITDFTIVRVSDSLIIWCTNRFREGRDIEAVEKPLKTLFCLRILYHFGALVFNLLFLIKLILKCLLESSLIVCYQLS